MDPEEKTATLFAIGYLSALMLASSLAHRQGREYHTAYLLKMRIKSKTTFDGKRFQDKLILIMKK